MKKVLLFIILLVLPFIINAEELNLEWQKSLGGSSYEVFYSVTQIKDDNYIAVGKTRSNDIDGITNDGDVLGVIVKYDINGNILWKKNWGEILESVAPTEDGGFVVVGYAEISYIMNGIRVKGSADGIIMKCDADGNILWQNLWGGNGNDQFYNVMPTKDNGVLVSGASSSTDIEGLSNKGDIDAIILKYDKDGNVLWEKSYGGSKSESFDNVVITENEDIIASGDTFSSDIDGLTTKGTPDGLIVKYDRDGNILWNKSWGGSGQEYFRSLILTKDDGYVVVGETNSLNPEGLTTQATSRYTDAIIVKYDKDGNVLWQSSWGGTKDDKFNSIALAKDGGYLVAGWFESSNIEGLPNKSNYLAPEAMIVKYNQNGKIMWQKSWGGNWSDEFNSIISTKNNEYVVVGTSTSTNIEGLEHNNEKDFIIVKYLIKYDLENTISETVNGTAEIIQEGNYGIITPQPNEGYKVEKVIIKDKEGNILDIEVTEQEDGTLTFPLYTDVSVEVIYALAIDNPKTGILDVMTILIIGFLMSITGFFIVKNYNERLEL